MDLIAKRHLFLGFSGALVLIAWVLVATLGLRPGIDLRGGTQWQVAFENPSVSEGSIRSSLSAAEGAVDVSVKRAGDASFILRLPDITEEQHQRFLAVLNGDLGTTTEKNFSSIGPTIGSELRRKSLWAIAAVLLGISLYIAWAFRKVSAPVRSWKYGVVTLVTLLHDVSIPTGLLAYLGWAMGVEIDTNFIVALLVVMGFSVHDTIVVFDRIRENLTRRRGQQVVLRDVINQSVNETIARSINTSLTLILVLLTLIAVGPPSLFFFILTILVGTVFGTYSSIFVASPLLFIWGKRGA